ncbi:hypothetical protein CryarDRAFT_3376 [Cryptosporangium arvum DSM 44712]|uniref:Golgi phosphoprotein 3 (GPP34) n=1 Tax=Cryptosporangium arvum DSM 44712 TaxID=927661 RepID=A0A010ZYE0_9ACTN|nr:hypothetical protein CryarDRAFT_3376 [Cryptosporangium arvum DSM 44712]
MNAVDVTLAEDLLLLLFRPGSGSFTGETTLGHVLAGAVLADLAHGGHVRPLPGWGGSIRVEAVAGRRPADEILSSAWDQIAAGPRGAQAALAVIGSTVRAAVLDRLVRRGDLRRCGRAGAFVVRPGGSGRRGRLVAEVRAVLVDGADPQPRAAALVALLSGSGTLPQFDPEIPWTPPVVARAQTLQRGNWGAATTADAIARTVTEAIVGNVAVAGWTVWRERRFY